MNLYLRYFDEETLVNNVDEAIEFLQSLPEITVNNALIKDLREYAASDDGFPKRYKVRPRVYFIVIKTEAQTMQDFKDKKALRSGNTAEQKTSDVMRLSEEREGWYEGTLEFKRVVTNHFGKCEYRDTSFVARCKALSPIDCYNKIIQHLSGRVDNRSQFPSVKGKNFKYAFLGKCK